MSFVETANPFPSLDVVITSILLFLWIIYRVFSKLSNTEEILKFDFKDPKKLYKQLKNVSIEQRFKSFSNSIQNLHLLFTTVLLFVLTSLLLEIGSEVLWSYIKYNPTSFGLFETNDFRLSYPNMTGNSTLLPAARNQSGILYTADVLSVASKGTFISSVFFLIAWLMRGVILEAGWIISGPSFIKDEHLKQTSQKNISKFSKGFVGYCLYTAVGVVSWFLFLILNANTGNKILPSNGGNQDLGIWEKVIEIRFIFIAASFFSILLMMILRRKMKKKWMKYNEAFGSDAGDKRILKRNGTKRYRLAARVVMWLSMYCVMQILSCVSLIFLLYNAYLLENKKPGFEIGYVESLIKIQNFAFNFIPPILVEILLATAMFDERSIDHILDEMEEEENKVILEQRKSKFNFEKNFNDLEEDWKSQINYQHQRAANQF